jgi:hypothetical protein
MANYYELFMDQGTTFSKDFSALNPATDESYDLTNFSARAQARKSYGNPNTSIVFAATVSNVTNAVTISVTANNSSNVPAGKYVYDVEIFSGETVYRIAEGIITVAPEVTR